MEIMVSESSLWPWVLTYLRLLPNLHCAQTNMSTMSSAKGSTPWVGRASCMPVVARTSTTRKSSAKGVPKKSQILSRVEKLKLLSRAEALGVLSLLENSGLTLETIESQKLLSKAEQLLPVVSDKGTPGKLTTLGVLALIAAGGLIYAIPDESTGQVLAQVLATVLLAGGALAAFAGSNLISDLQRTD